MNKGSYKLLWISFCLVSILTWIVYSCLSGMDSYVTLLLSLAAINFLQGLWILIDRHFARRVFFLVLLALAIGQFWLFLWLGIFLLWKTNGFAP